MSADGHVTSDIRTVSRKAISDTIDSKTDQLVYTINIAMNVSQRTSAVTRRKKNNYGLIMERNGEKVIA